MREVVNLHIENLILEGIPERDRESVAEGLRVELGRLLTESGVPSNFERGVSLPAIDAGFWSGTPGARPEAVGASIARTVYHGMANSKSGTR